MKCAYLTEFKNHVWYNDKSAFDFFNLDCQLYIKDRFKVNSDDVKYNLTMNVKGNFIICLVLQWILVQINWKEYKSSFQIHNITE